MGYIIDVIADLSNIDLDNIYVNGVKVPSEPRLSNDGSLFLLRGDQFSQPDSGIFPLYFDTNEQVITYLNEHPNDWARQS